MSIRICFLTLFLIVVQSSFAQTKYTINGYVRDSASGESIIGATVSVSAMSRSVMSNQYGFYSMTLDSGSYALTVSHVSYVSKQEVVTLNQNIQSDFLILSKSASIDEVIVYSKRKDANVRNAQMGRIDLSINQIKNIPAFMGEVDILKTLQLLPGVRNAGEGNAGFYVRGGGPDQNLIMLDDAVVYNTGHLFGFFSIFNSDAIKNTSLIKGGMP
ncbi:MAG TPA: TonB-dependent receptor, partial [Chitinophagaceae bacterium]|nr:TonB-dependent receptor [Chitinophagaceae bacterium]